MGNGEACDGEVVVEWSISLCRLVRESTKVPEDWERGMIVPVYKVKKERWECNTYRRG